MVGQLSHSPPRFKSEANSKLLGDLSESLMSLLREQMDVVTSKAIEAIQNSLLAAKQELRQVAQENCRRNGSAGSRQSSVSSERSSPPSSELSGSLLSPAPSLQRGLQPAEESHHDHEPRPDQEPRSCASRSPMLRKSSLAAPAGQELRVEEAGPSPPRICKSSPSNEEVRVPAALPLYAQQRPRAARQKPPSAPGTPARHRRVIALNVREPAEVQVLRDALQPLARENAPAALRMAWLSPGGSCSASPHGSARPPADGEGVERADLDGRRSSRALASGAGEQPRGHTTTCPGKTHSVVPVHSDGSTAKYAYEVAARHRPKTPRPANSRIGRVAAACTRKLRWSAPRALGTLPWSFHYPVASLVYQWAVVLVMFCAAAVACARVHYAQGSDPWGLFPGKLGESSDVKGSYIAPLLPAAYAVLACGGALALLVLQPIFAAGGPSFSDIDKLLEEYAGDHSYIQDLIDVSIYDQLFGVIVWVSSMLTTAMAAPGGSAALTVSLLSTGVINAVLLGLAFAFVQVCRSLWHMVESFCSGVVTQQDFIQAVKEWNLQQALVKTTCSRVEQSFLILGVAAGLAFLLLAISIVEGGFELETISPLLMVVCLAQILARAAMVTDKCQRVPSIINAVAVDEDRVTDTNRLYAVHYISFSRAGFVIKEVVVGSDSILKMGYLTCLAAFQLVAQVFSKL